MLTQAPPTFIPARNEIDQEIIELPATTHILTECSLYLKFIVNNSRHSDITINAFGNTWNLHKIILLQSPFLERNFNREINDSLYKYSNLVLHLDTFQLGIEMFGDLEKCALGFGIALKDIYAVYFKLMLKLTCRASFRFEHITADNVIHVLLAACFLELNELAQHCTDSIIKLLSSVQPIVSIIEDLQIRPKNSSYSDHKFYVLYSKYFKVIEEACMASLCFCISGY
jgi:hypothetical protein